MIFSQPTNRQRKVCGNCGAGLPPDDKYCRICGTDAEKGVYEPVSDLMQCIYGPMPVMRKHTCTRCGHAWETCVMIDNTRYCPRCGAPVTTECPDNRGMGAFVPDGGDGK